jgi:DNA polymerase IV
VPPLPRRILLADADAFFVAVARLVDPDGAGREPLLIVGGTRESRGVVCSASYETRKYGVRSAMPISRALRLCPQAVCVPVPRKACSQKHREIRAVLERHAPMVEGASIDEWYLDLGGTEALYHHEPLEETAARIRRDVVRETGLSVSFGGGTSKLIAKLAVEHAKHGTDGRGAGVHVVSPGAEMAFMRGIKLAEIPLVGPRFQERLGRLGMRTVPDVLQYDPVTLTQWLGEREAAWLWDRVHGIDSAHVEPHLDAKSLSRDETFGIDINDDAALQRELLALLTRAAADLRAEGLAARTIRVKIRDWDFKTRQAGRTLDHPVISDRILLSVARGLLQRLRAARRVPARLIGVALSSLSTDVTADQLDLFEARDNRFVETDRDRRVVRAVDRVRARFGDKGILPGGLVGRE